MRRALDAVAVAMVVGPIGAVTAWILWNLVAMVRGSDPGMRLAAWFLLGILSVFVGILLGTRNDGRMR